jgi:hypothetical protein
VIFPIDKREVGSRTLTAAAFNPETSNQRVTRHSRTPDVATIWHVNWWAGLYGHGGSARAIRESATVGISQRIFEDVGESVVPPSSPIGSDSKYLPMLGS